MAELPVIRKYEPIRMTEVMRIPVRSENHYSYITVSVEGELTDEMIDRLKRYLVFIRAQNEAPSGIRSDNTDAEKLIL